MMSRLRICRDRTSSRGELVPIRRFGVSRNLVRFCIRWFSIPTEGDRVRHSGETANCSKVRSMNGNLMYA